MYRQVFWPRCNREVTAALAVAILNQEVLEMFSEELSGSPGAGGVH